LLQWVARLIQACRQSAPFHFSRVRGEEFTPFGLL
jgi:hypothetical protein